MGLFACEMKPNVDSLKDPKTWGKLLMEAIGTALWIIVGTKLGGDWGWGLSFAVISIAFPDYTFNTLTNWGEFLTGGTDWLSFLLTWFAHCIGSIFASAITGPLALGDINAESSLSFRAADAEGNDVPGGAFTLQFWTFWFGKEMIGIFLFTCFMARSKGNNDVPATIWTVLMVTVAFWLGGSGFMFFPARLFSSWSAFAGQGAWATFICQMWSVLLAKIFLEWVWTE